MTDNPLVSLRTLPSRAVCYQRRSTSSRPSRSFSALGNTSRSHLCWDDGEGGERGRVGGRSVGMGEGRGRDRSRSPGKSLISEKNRFLSIPLESHRERRPFLTCSQSLSGAVQVDPSMNVFKNRGGKDRLCLVCFSGILLRVIS